jgi:hypothetical protein
MIAGARGRKGTARAGALLAVLALAGCESNLNPVNWFGGPGVEGPTIRLREAPQAVDRRPLVDQVAQLSLERTAGGTLVTAVGLPTSQGYWDTALLPEARGIDGRPAAQDGVIRLRFVAVPPPAPQPVGTPLSRQVSAGLFLSDQTLQGVARVEVVGDRNRRAARP